MLPSARPDASSACERERGFWGIGFRVKGVGLWDLGFRAELIPVHVLSVQDVLSPTADGQNPA